MTWNGYYIILIAEYYEEGGTYIHYDVYLSQEAYANSDDPLLTADYILSPDQTGSGRLTTENITYRVIFDKYGSDRISNIGKSKEINIYR
jgi:hypothetical protein